MSHSWKLFNILGAMKIWIFQLFISEKIIQNSDFVKQFSNFESFWKEIDIICNEDTEECGLEDIFVPDPTNFELPEDFIFIENDWGSFFYKHLGRMARNDARKNCSSFGPSVHLPIPRFIREFEFYRAHFGYTAQLNDDSKGS